MKKLSLFIVSFCIALFFVNAQSINITSPGGGENWNSGETINISWTKAGTMDAEVKIRLYNEAGLRVLEITDSTDNNGLFPWIVPGTISAGNYAIRVKTIDNAVSDDSNMFSINAGIISTGSISVSNPNSSTSFPLARWAQSIEWDTSGENHDFVSIQVIPQGNPSGAMLIIANTENDSAYDWRDPGSLTGPGRFFVRVKTLDGAVWGDSEVFVVREPPASPVRIDLINPESTSNWNVGSPRMISWRIIGEMSDRVSIKLYDHTGTILKATISDGTDNDESEHWFVQEDLAEARYLMRIATTDGLVTGDSDVFPITRPRDPPPPATPANIKIKSPNETTIWRAGQKAEIVWASTSIRPGRVKIELFKQRTVGVFRVITPNIKNIGKYLWKIPITFLGGKYSIKITRLDTASYGSSSLFLIKSRRLNLRTKK